MSARSWTLVNPATEEAFLTVPYTEARELAATVERTRAAQHEWRRVPVHLRAV